MQRFQIVMLYLLIVYQLIRLARWAKRRFWPRYSELTAFRDPQDPKTEFTILRWDRWCLPRPKVVYQFWDEASSIPSPSTSKEILS